MYFILNFVSVTTSLCSLRGVACDCSRPLAVLIPPASTTVLDERRADSADAAAAGEERGGGGRGSAQGERGRFLVGRSVYRGNRSRTQLDTHHARGGHSRAPRQSREASCRLRDKPPPPSYHPPRLLPLCRLPSVSLQAGSCLGAGQGTAR